MSKVINLAAAGFVLASAGALTAAPAFGASPPPSPAAPASATPGSDLNKDLQNAQTGEKASAGDVQTASEQKEDGQVGNVDVQQNQTGDQGTANDKAEATGQKDEKDLGNKDDSGALQQGTQGAPKTP